MGMYRWQRKLTNLEGYECSSAGDKRFSALNAKMPDGRSIEQWYQCDIKGYDIGGVNWKLGKGKPPLFKYPKDHLWYMYLNLWRMWAIAHSTLMVELIEKVNGRSYVITDCFATTEINQARALVTILNEWGDI